MIVMLKKTRCLILISLLVQIQLFAHTGKPKYHVIIDTDGAIDDMRAISMFLAANDIRILAITCSQGTVVPNSGYLKVNSLLSAFYHEGIPVGIGDGIIYPLPEWNGFSEKINWGNALINPQYKENAIDLISRITKDYPAKITLIALGSLKTYADWLKNNPENARKIERIIWYSDTELEKSFNYYIDTVSFNFIKKSNIPICIVSNNRNDLICNQQYLNYIKNSKSIYARQIYKVHNQQPVLEKIKQNHLQLWDDLLPLYLAAPILFKSEKKDSINYVTLEKSIPADFIYETIANVLISGTSTNNRVFTSFPVDPTLYKKEYAEIINSTIEKYGEIEWKAITMTNEIHGHTGIYSIIGAKMGVRATEYFNVGVNNLIVTSFVGYKPPFSCLNDGIQISTGATIGQGLITVSDTIAQIPTVVFEFNNQKIKIALKNEIANKMEDDIKQAVKKYGMTDKYWLYIEELAIKYWADFDRHEIFTIDKL
jgi:inosine-uridine nucleoside N-ribohydrolase/formylmethanofuran dehydrogenase subunit E